MNILSIYVYPYRPQSSKSIRSFANFNRSKELIVSDLKVQMMDVFGVSSNIVVSDTSVVTQVPYYTPTATSTTPIVSTLHHS